MLTDELEGILKTDSNLEMSVQMLLKSVSPSLESCKLQNNILNLQESLECHY